eukprot:61523-Amphidinium_carterae.1
MRANNRQLRKWHVWSGGHCKDRLPTSSADTVSHTWLRWVESCSLSTVLPGQITPNDHVGLLMPAISWVRVSSETVQKARMSVSASVFFSSR